MSLRPLRFVAFGCALLLGVDSAWAVRATHNEFVKRPASHLQDVGLEGHHLQAEHLKPSQRHGPHHLAVPRHLRLKKGKIAPEKKGGGRGKIRARGSGRFR